MPPHSRRRDAYATGDYAYDSAGNLRSVEQPAGPVRQFTHDAWNRLVQVESDVNVIRSQFEYNGLHWRTVKRDDSETIPDGTLDQQRNFYYNANWQLIEERIDEDYPTDSDIDRIAQQVWGPRYIDDAVVRRVDGNADGTYVPGSTSPDSVSYYLTDVQFSTVVMMGRRPVLMTLSMPSLVRTPDRER